MWWEQLKQRCCEIKARRVCVTRPLRGDRWNTNAAYCTSPGLSDLWTQHGCHRWASLPLLCIFLLLRSSLGTFSLLLLCSVAPSSSPPRSLLSSPLARWPHVAGTGWLGAGGGIPHTHIDARTCSLSGSYSQTHTRTLVHTHQALHYSLCAPLHWPVSVCVWLQQAVQKSKAAHLLIGLRHVYSRSLHLWGICLFHVCTHLH